MPMYTGLCLSDPHPDYFSDGSGLRTLSATRFAGRYRVVDFMLSNMVNAGIYDIGMILNSHYQSLIGHIGMGKEWGLARKSGGITFFPPYLTDERQSVNSEIDGPLQRAVQSLSAAKTEYIVLVDSSMIYNMDYRRAMEAHRSSGADVTAIYSKKKLDPGCCENTVVFDILNGQRVVGVGLASDSHGTEQRNVSLGAYIMQKKIFLQLVAGEKNCGMLRFSRTLLAEALGRLRVLAYEFKGYSAQICSVETFFQHNMEMLDSEKRNALFNFENRRIFTSRRDTLPTKYGQSAEITNSIIADGCQIEGTVINSVICRNVLIKPGAVVKDCILQGGTVVEKHAELGWIITDRSVIISENRKLIGANTYPAHIARERVI